MKAWLWTATITAGLLAIQADFIVFARSQTHTTKKVAGRVTGSAALWPTEVVSVALLKGSGDRLRSEIAAGGLPVIELKKDTLIRKVASLAPTDRNMDGSFEFQDVPRGVYHAVVLTSCPGDARGLAIGGGSVVTMADRDIAQVTLIARQARVERCFTSSGRALSASVDSTTGLIVWSDTGPEAGATAGLKRVAVAGSVTSAPSMEAKRIAVVLVEMEGGRLASGLELEARQPLDRRIAELRVAAGSALAVDTGGFTFTNVLPGRYRVEARDVTPQLCGGANGRTIGSAGQTIESRAIAVRDSDVRVDLPVNWGVPVRGAGGNSCGGGGAPPRGGGAPSRGGGPGFGRGGMGPR